jgi:hypothetical protein
LTTKPTFPFDTPEQKASYDLFGDPVWYVKYPPGDAQYNDQNFEMHSFAELVELYKNGRELLAY